MLDHPKGIILLSKVCVYGGEGGENDVQRAMSPSASTTSPPQTNIELTREEDFAKILELEEEQVRRMCDDIIALKPDLVISEKGVSDLAQHFLVKHNISCIRRVKKSDNNRVAR